MTCHYPDLGCTSDLSCRKGNFHQPVRITVQNWVVRYHQCGISALIPQASFFWATINGVAKFRMVSQAIYG